MKIKKVSIQGFKSFMNRLEITFPGGISGVVGPNGCGKSNIVDAIQWCMGEQSPKQLRGRRMEDVIFNGAGDEKPLGMAEVSILFENGDGTFPPAFATDPEFSVTRRLYRSGESEYLINRMPCRLKDIQEVFMDTGLGNKAYSIIGQGKIGTILEQKPEDTRVMLEEAAGVTKYRKRVEISQKKIELTEANLQRVEDIQGELQRQMRSLKRQASKAKRYKAVCEKIQNLELILYANTYHQFKEDLGDKLKSTEDLVRQEIAKSTEFSHLHARIETVHQELEEKDATLARCNENLLLFKEKTHKKESAIDSLMGEMRMQEQLEGRLRSEKVEIKNRLTSLKKEKAALQEALQNSKGISHELGIEITLKEKRLKSRQGLLKELKEDYENARDKLNSGTNKEVGLNHESGYLNRMLNQITDSSSRLEKEIKDVEAKIEKVINASQRKSLAREAASGKLREIGALIEELDLNCEKLDQAKTRAELDLRSAEADLNVCQSRLASIRTLTENFEGYKMGVRTIMKAKDFTPRQKGRIFGLLADVIQVDPKYEQAVESVLADRLQYVIVESQEDGKQAIDYLKLRARGKGSFVPLKDLKCDENRQEKDPQFPLLQNLISVPETYKQIMKTLLEDTVLVENLDVAMSAWKTNGKDRCYVTLEGDIVDQGGVVTGGKLTKSSRGLLVRKREMAELKVEAAKHQKNVDDLKIKLEKINTESQGKKEALEDLTEDRWNCQDEINEFDKMLFRLSQELDQLEKLSQKISEDLKRKEREQNKHKQELLKIDEELQQHKSRRKEEEEYFQKKEAELKESEEEVDQLRDELAKCKVKQGVLEEEQRGMAREIGMKDEYADDSYKRLEKIEEDVSKGKEKVVEGQRRKEIIEDELKETSEKLKAASEDVNRADGERQECLNKIKEAEKKAEQIREEIDAVKDIISRARMEHSEIQFKMDNLVEMAREKANMDLREVYGQYLDEGFSQKEVEERLEHTKTLRQRLGDVNLTAIKEHEALKERYDFIKSQREDLIASIESLRIAIKKINRTSLEKFEKTFHEVDEKLKEIFPILFNGGTASLKLIDEERPLESGVLVEVKPPGKKLSHMGLLSGGEKALVAMTLLFAIYMIKPSPFCLLDEVDSPLDEANLDRFNDLLKEIRKSSQIIMVTHSRRTMEITDRLYGVTMERPGISNTVSVDIEDMRNQVPENPPNDQPTVH